MDVRQLETLVAVADHGSFSAAARSLYTVQSNVSAHIARLERDLGVQLVDRDRGGLTDDMRTDIIISAVPPYWDLRARRIVFPAQTTDMQVRAVEFNYNLVAMSETRQADFHFTYDAEADGWKVVE